MHEADTLAGFVFGLLGHQPVTGETAAWHTLEFRIETTDGRRIQRVRVIRGRKHEARAVTDDETPRDERNIIGPLAVVWVALSGLNPGVAITL
jgi:hypothetical protein